MGTTPKTIYEKPYPQTTQKLIKVFIFYKNIYIYKYLYIFSTCCWRPAWTICSAKLCNKGRTLGGIRVGGVYIASSKLLFCCSEWLLPPRSPWCPGDPDGRSELGRHSKRRSGSTGLLKCRTQSKDSWACFNSWDCRQPIICKCKGIYFDLLYQVKQ